MKLTALSLVLSMLFLPLTGVSQVTITTAPGTYSQNFNGTFLSTVNYTLADNSGANLGWYSLRSTGQGGSGNVFTANTGTLTGQFFNYGAAGNTERALGSAATVGVTGTVYYGLRIRNGTSSPLQSVRVQYTGEQWLAFFPVAQTLAFSYQVSPTPITSLTGAFTAFPDLDFATPVNNFDGALNGNAAPNRTVIDETFFVAIPSGSEIMLRWEDVAEAPLISHGIAIDDVTVTLSALGPTAAPVSISGRVTTANGGGIGGAVLVLSGGQLEQPIVARTNPFGYYQINGAPAGATYLLEISARRYTFSQTSQVIHAQDNVTGVDFIAE